MADEKLKEFQTRAERVLNAQGGKGQTQSGICVYQRRTRLERFLV